MKKLLIGLLNFYRNFLSPLKGPTCRYYPTCSEYMIQAVEQYGVCSGLLKGFWRILRCNPYSKGGYDPVK